MKQIFLALIATAILLGPTTFSEEPSDCVTDCIASGEAIAAATGCIECGLLHAQYCVQFECK